VGIVSGWIRALRGDAGSRPGEKPGDKPTGGRVRPAGRNDLQFFETAQPDPPTPVTRERVEALLDEQGLGWFVDHEGDLGLMFQSRLHHVLLLGPGSGALQVRGQWNRLAAIERLDDLLELCQQVNLERVWPSVFVQVRDDGAVAPTAQVSTFLPYGATDEQLATFVLGGLGVINAFFDALDDVYPDPVAEAP